MDLSGASTQSIAIVGSRVLSATPSDPSG
ncbi:hypothetical protein SVEN_7076 [Streptomyces venezuelae ATCC 10712]|uniref:Uncharacterized protein n=1 Tax=Streptomyces venezuelae (strain ATCC 10712 / CBS 650.69 / DSM 40230 / JCM 4526 / NBRC 13096 / PD 04745) TaxID=953739 RepID=F2RKK6_STRVP|nr:hypothetical protein SVEN_7076 [Streptomyces venezuelae ATCC 10712]